MLNPKDELNFFLDVALSQGCDLLEKSGFFYPYALAMEANGSIVRSPEFKEKIAPEQVAEEIKTQLSHSLKQENYFAVALGLDVKAKKNNSSQYVKAINIWIKSKDGQNFDIFLPYTKKQNQYIWQKIFYQKI